MRRLPIVLILVLIVVAVLMFSGLPFGKLSVSSVYADYSTRTICTVRYAKLSVHTLMPYMDVRLSAKGLTFILAFLNEQREYTLGCAKYRVKS
jgi:hypothetical protein